MYRLRCASAWSRFAGCCAIALALAGCAGPTGEALRPPAIGPAEPLAAGGFAQAAHGGGESRHLTSAEQDWIVARAIAAHEMRHP
jgi:hypothetical protein